MYIMHIIYIIYIYMYFLYTLYYCIYVYNEKKNTYFKNIFDSRLYQFIFIYIIVIYIYRTLIKMSCFTN